MELLDTIPIYYAPTWLLIVIGLSLLSLFILLCDWPPTDNKQVITAILSILTLLVSLIFIWTGACNYHHHDEYVVRLDNSYSATEFFKNYEIINTYDYSDALHVKKKEGVK